jgi:hypothetical protein
VVEGEIHFTSLQLPWLVAQSVYYPRHRLIIVFLSCLLLFGSGCYLVNFVNIVDTLLLVFGVSSFARFVLGGPFVVEI